MAFHVLICSKEGWVRDGPRVNAQSCMTKEACLGFPGGAVVESLPADARDTGSSPGLGRSHMPRSNWAREPQLLRLRVWSLCSTTREAAMVRGPHTAMKSDLRLPQLEKDLAQKRRPNTAKNKYKNKFKKKKKKEVCLSPSEIGDSGQLCSNSSSPSRFGAYGVTQA